MKYLFISLLAACLFIPFLGKVHLFDWDEINFAESAREMIVTHNYSEVQIDFKPFWEKPPLFIWMQAASMKIFGVNAFAARLPNALMGILTLLLLFAIGKNLSGERFGLWWTLLYAASWLPHFYFKSGIIDPTFNFFIFLAIYFAFRIRYAKNKTKAAIFSGVFLGLAVLTKGPVAILVSLLALGVYWIWKRGKIFLKWNHLGWIALFSSAFIIAWFGYIAWTNGWGLILEFIQYQIRLFSTPDAGHGGPFYYHWVVLLLGCFPASIFLFFYLVRRKPSPSLEFSEKEADFQIWMWILFWVVLILFSIVKTKIVHYSSLCYFPLTYLATVQVNRLWENKDLFKRWMIILFGSVGLLLAGLITALPLIGLYKDRLIPYIQDPFAVANLQAKVPWSPLECWIGGGYALLILFLVGLFLNKRIRAGLWLMVVGQILVIQITILHFVPKVEAYSQRAAIEFFQSLQGKEVYVHVLGYKSYAPLYYTRMQPPTNPHYDQEAWLLNGKVDKPVYFVCKITAKDYYAANPNLKLIGEKNGFVFFQRK
ncbi:MAG: ArnT family glycosyltransferase [Chitinophagaceae bacterium]